jgi:3',5'-cyclic AMP phosphodiesterase CpdA
MLTIAQITDIHVTTDKDPVNKARNAARLKQVLKNIHALAPRPAAIIASGDLVDHGTPEEYAELKLALADVEIPLLLGMGNHDGRKAFQDAFPDVPADDAGFVQYASRFGDLRVVMCDTLEQGKDGGGFCEARAAWLARTLDEAPEVPTIVVLHHPPIPSGIQWMDEPADAPWIVRLGAVLKGRKQIVTLACGHIHRTYHGFFAGQLVSVSPASSLQLTPNFTPIDKRVADGREILREEPPGYTIYAWDGCALASHICVAGDFAQILYTRPFIAS